MSTDKLYIRVLLQFIPTQKMSIQNCDVSRRSLCTFIYGYVLCLFALTQTYLSLGPQVLILLQNMNMGSDIIGLPAFEKRNHSYCPSFSLYEQFVTAVAMHQQNPQRFSCFTLLCVSSAPLAVSPCLCLCVWCRRGAPSPHSPGSWLPAHLPPISSSLLNLINPGSPRRHHPIVDSATVIVTCFRPPWRCDPENYSSCLFPADYLLSSLLVPQVRLISARLPAYNPCTTSLHFSQPSSALHSTSVPPVPHNNLL